MLSMSDLEVVDAHRDNEVVAAVSETCNGRAAFATLQLVRRVIATAYETYEGEPTLLMLLRTHSMITAEQLSTHALNIDEFAYNALIELSLSNEPGDWWSKLETFQVSTSLNAYAPQEYGSGDDKEGDEHLFKTDRVAEQYAEGRNSNVYMIAAVHTWLSLSFPRRRYPIPVQLVETQAGEDLALWYQKYPALGRMMLKSPERYFTLDRKANEIRNRRHLKACFSAWLTEAASVQVFRHKALTFRMKVLFSRWQQLLAQRSKHWLITFKAFAEWKYQSYYDSQMRSYFREWRRHARSSKRRYIVFQYRISSVWLKNKRWAFEKMRSNENFYRQKWRLHLQRKFFQQWYHDYVEWRKKARHAANWIRVMDRVLVTKSLNIWMEYTTLARMRKQALAHIADTLYHKAAKQAFCRMSQGQSTVANPRNSTEEKDLISMLIRRHDRALQTVLHESAR